MDIFRRILRYLILWAVLFVILCIISVVRYWDELVAIISGTIYGYIEFIIGVGLLIGLILWGISRLFRTIR